VSDNPFPDSRPLTAADIGEPTGWNLYGHPDAEPFAFVAAGDTTNPYYAFVALSDRVEWRRCDCPWWHKLPFVGRFVHSELP
jgi:hypothetical protein